MTALATRDPAVAIAMGHCLNARVMDPDHRVTDRHARECGWCPYPAEELRAGILEFREWAQFDDRHGTTGQHITRSWADLRPAERERRIAAAQELGNDLWAAPPPEPVALPGERLAKAAPHTAEDPEQPVVVPSPHIEEEIPSWLR